MEESGINSLLQKSTQKSSKSRHSGFPGFKETPFSRKHLESMPDYELYRTYKLYCYHITSKIYQNIGGVIKPSRFPLSDYLSGERTNLIKKRLHEAQQAASTVSLHMKNVLLIADVIRTKFPNLLDEEEDDF